MEVVLFLLFYCIAGVMTDVLVCSEFLVSGFHGVNDSALISSSIFDKSHQHDCSPGNARLFYPGDTSIYPFRIGGWISASLNTDEFIQVNFPVDTVITGVTTQGRYKDYQHWVKSYYLLHSMDNVIWTTVTSSDGTPKIFTGNTDTNTPVTSSVYPNITVRYLRINPQTWEIYPTIRFDVSGCHIKKIDRGSQFKKKFAVPSRYMGDVQSVVGPLTTSISFVDCAKACHKQNTCMSFALQNSVGGLSCTGYSAWVVENDNVSLSMQVFVRQDILDTYGYKEDQETAILYNIVEVRQDQGSAAKACTSMYTRLMVVDKLTKMEGLIRIIAGYDVLSHDFRFFIAGTYTSSVWSYTGDTGDVIDSDLWSLGNPDQGQGHCVMLTESGLASVHCQEQLFAICGN